MVVDTMTRPPRLTKAVPLESLTYPGRVVTRIELPSSFTFTFCSKQCYASTKKVPSTGRRPVWGNVDNYELNILVFMTLPRSDQHTLPPRHHLSCVL
eukprot:7007598-Prymnesium_polylepis.1